MGFLPNPGRADRRAPESATITLAYAAKLFSADGSRGLEHQRTTDLGRDRRVVSQNAAPDLYGVGPSDRQEQVTATNCQPEIQTAHEPSAPPPLPELYTRNRVFRDGEVRTWGAP